VQRLDERFDAAVSTLAAAEERLSLAEHDGAQHAQQRNVARCRCVAGNRFFFSARAQSFHPSERLIPAEQDSTTCMTYSCNIDALCIA